MIRLASFVVAISLATAAAAQTQPRTFELQKPGEIQRPTGPWQVPGEIQKPTGPWQVPGEIQKPTGPWQKPGEFQKPGQLQTVKESCRTRLVFGSDTLFAFDKADLTPEAEVTLVKVAEQVKESKGKVTIEGHTDGKGSDSYNQGLSERRARSVRDWLVSRKATAPGTPIAGFGKRKPIAPNANADGSDNPDGRALNRRVEVVIATCA